LKKSIERKIKSVEERLQRLSALSKSLPSFENYQASPDTKDIAERNIQVAIETCLDIGKIIISNESLSEPKDNKGIFVVLSETGYLTSASLSFMVPMAGTRNILVHGYDKVDDGLIFGILKRHIDDFDIFLRQIKNNYLMRK